LRDGTIINAFGSSRVARLTNYLRSEGIITEEELEKCMKISAHTEKKIGMVLVEQGIISPEQLESLLHRQIEETLYSLFLWEQGEFQYRDQNFDLSGQIITSFDTMQVVLEASRRVDEISEIRKRVPTDNEVLVKNPDSEALQKTELNTVERAVLSLINGKRSVKRIIIDSGYDELKVYKTLFSLVSSGLLLEEKKILKRPEDLHEEIVDPADGKNIDSAGKNGGINAEDKDSESEKIFDMPDELQSETQQSRDAGEAAGQNQARGEISDAAVKSEGAAEPAVHNECVGSPDDAQQDQEQDEMILEPESDIGEQSDIEPGPVPDLLDSLRVDQNHPDKTIVKIDGKLVSEDEIVEKESGKSVRPKSAGETPPVEVLTPFRKHQGLAEDDEAFVQEKQRLLKKVALWAVAVLAVVVVVLLLKIFLFPASESPIQLPETEQQQVTKKKSKKSVEQKKSKPAVQEKKKIEPEAELVAPESAFDFFQDEKGWVSINLPRGFTVSEQPHSDRTRVTIQYEGGVNILLSIMPQSDTWDAEDDMYAFVMKLQESGTRKVQKYTTLKNAGCPGYVLHFLNEQDYQSIQTALYRFVCFNKNVRIEVTSLNWRTSSSQELCQKIYSTIETSFFVYQ